MMKSSPRHFFDASVAALLLVTSLPSPAAEMPRAFFEQHCPDCHDATEKKGGLDLTALKTDFPDAENFARWVKVHDLIESGEMPPKKKERPAAAEKVATLKWLRDSLVAADVARRGNGGRSSVRRLNRVEYENTLRDLLGTPVHVQALLPEDGSVGGFDTVSTALGISPSHLVSYQHAADAALAEALTTTNDQTVREKFTGREWFDRELKAGRKNVPRGAVAEGETAVLLRQTPQHWELNVMPQREYTRAGLYRVRLTAQARNTGGRPLPVRFGWEWMLASTQLTHIIGYRDVPADKPTTIEVLMDVPSAGPRRVGATAFTLPALDDKSPPLDPATDAGLVVHQFEVEGPLGGWPSAGQQVLFGDLPLEPRSFATARAAGQAAPSGDWMKWGAHEFEKNPLIPVSSDPQADAERLVRAFLLRAFRRSVEPDVAEYYVQFARERLKRRDEFGESVLAAYRAILCSPHFFMLNAKPGLLDDFALASRLSYFLWSSMPDDGLLALAAKGELHKPAVLRAQVERLLADEKAKRFVTNFTGQWLGLRTVLVMKPDELDAEYDDALAWSLGAETERFFAEMLAKDLSVTEFVHSDWTMLNERLAKHYGVTGVAGMDFRRVPLLPEHRRGGVITHASILKLTANGSYTSPIKRGVWLLDRIIGKPPEPPPDDVTAIEPDIRGATTLREQIEKHRAVPKCAGCHAKIDPPGFALESYDVLGGWRDRYRAPGGVDGKSALLPLANYPEKKQAWFTSAVDPASVTPEGEPFANLDEYKRLLLRDPDQLARNIARKLVIYGTGADLQFADREVLEQIVVSARESHHGLRSIIHALVQSRLFLEK